MKTLKELLFLEEQALMKQVEFLESRADTYPEGRLKLSRSNGVVQYYFRTEEAAKAGRTEDDNENAPEISKPAPVDGKDVTNKPVPKYKYKKDPDLAASIAQRDYEKLLLKELRDRLRAVQKSRIIYEKTSPETALLRFCENRQKLIQPIYLTDEAYVEMWQQEQYEKKTFADNTPEIYTIKGERVRSKSEKIIADTLIRYEIPYKYEYLLQLAGFGQIHPDFCVLNRRTRQEFYWEHLGMMDDEKYVRDAVLRIEAYEKNDIFPGEKLLLSTETKTMPLNMRLIEKMIQRFLL